MSEQLVFELAPPEAPSFANFLAGDNGEVLEALTRIANGMVPETGLLVWGAPGSGKSHLLQATAAACGARGQRAVSLPAPESLEAREIDELASHRLVAVDAVDTADVAAQGRLFTLFNALAARGGHLVAASRVPPARMAVREDLRTRLGWGLVYETTPLADDAKPAALVAYARQRGFNLAPDVVRYLLAHGRRDMATLLATLAALDRHSLATKRPVTIPMLRAWLQGELPGTGTSAAR
ncbi:MAG: DnaA regulatory inactivator Hda [Casimicrobiaceae bacterium]